MFIESDFQIFFLRGWACGRSSTSEPKEKSTADLQQEGKNLVKSAAPSWVAHYIVVVVNRHVRTENQDTPAPI